MKTSFFLIFASFLAFICEPVQAQVSQIIHDMRALQNRDQRPSSTLRSSSTSSSATQNSNASPEETVEKERQDDSNEQYEQGKVAFDQGDWVDAEAYFKNSLRIEPNDPNILCLLAITQNHEGVEAYRKLRVLHNSAI